MTLARAAFPFLRPFLHALDAETAHRATIALLKAAPRAQQGRQTGLATRCFGLDFPNPLGLAAGFDKNAEVPDAMLAQRFGFVEIGTVTPKPQAGNPCPRLFRLAEDEAVINRMGFNNEGQAAVRRRLEARAGRGGIVGVNIGANKDSTDRIEDYVAGLETFADLASYVTVNISSPNTPGLRNLQAAEELKSLLDRLNEVRARRRTPPLLVKLAPDLEEDDVVAISHLCLDREIDGLIISNTTIIRPALRSGHAGEHGGLSGKPLFALSTRVLAQAYLATGGKLPLIGVGGIHDAETAWAKLTAGASLLQLYSALVYRGPALVTEILSGLTRKLAESGLPLTAITGSKAEAWTHQSEAGT
ncbi:MAG: quinone-dependent dihydroorotate dehydrogenase [Parvibaculaceae bacterium]